jgi:glycosyltransferase involved in cell wall biosynthesis
MRIGIDARLWNETGVGRYIRNLVWELQVLDKKNDYTLFVSKELRSEDLRLKNEKWKIVETDIRWHTLKEQLQFPKILEKENLDLVHFPYFSVPIYYNKPFVITIHDLIINHYPTGKASTLPSPIYYLKLMGYKFIIKQAAQKAQEIITVSQSTKNEIVKHLQVSDEKIIVTYEGVENREKGKKSKDKKFNYPFFLYVGNAYPHKNIERLIDVFVLVIKDYPDVKLVLVGNKNYFYERLEQRVKGMYMDKHILFTGNITEEELISLYHQANALILPSLMEGFGLPGLEAMQSGCLVLASDIPVFKEIYQDAAIYFNPLEIESLSATIREVLQDKKKFQPFIEKGKKRLGDFSWRKMAENTLKIYESSTRVRSD